MKRFFLFPLLIRPFWLLCLFFCLVIEAVFFLPASWAGLPSGPRPLDGSWIEALPQQWPELGPGEFLLKHRPGDGPSRISWELEFLPSQIGAFLPLLDLGQLEDLLLQDPDHLRIRELEPERNEEFLARWTWMPLMILPEGGRAVGYNQNPSEVKNILQKTYLATQDDIKTQWVQLVTQKVLDSFLPVRPDFLRTLSQEDLDFLFQDLTKEEKSIQLKSLFGEKRLILSPLSILSSQGAQEAQGEGDRGRLQGGEFNSLQQMQLLIQRRWLEMSDEHRRKLLGLKFLPSQIQGELLFRYWSEFKVNLVMDAPMNEKLGGLILSYPSRMVSTIGFGGIAFRRDIPENLARFCQRIILSPEQVFEIRYRDDFHQRNLGQWWEDVLTASSLVKQTQRTFEGPHRGVQFDLSSLHIHLSQKNRSFAVLAELLNVWYLAHLLDMDQYNPVELFGVDGDGYGYEYGFSELFTKGLIRLLDDRGFGLWDHLELRQSIGGLRETLSAVIRFLNLPEEEAVIELRKEIRRLLLRPQARSNIRKIFRSMNGVSDDHRALYIERCVRILLVLNRLGGAILYWKLFLSIQRDKDLTNSGGVSLSYTIKWFSDNFISSLYQEEKKEKIEVLFYQSLYPYREKISRFHVERIQPLLKHLEALGLEKIELYSVLKGIMDEGSKLTYEDRLQRVSALLHSPLSALPGFSSNAPTSCSATLSESE